MRVSTCALENFPIEDYEKIALEGVRKTFEDGGRLAVPMAEVISLSLPNESKTPGILYSTIFLPEQFDSIVDKELFSFILKKAVNDFEGVAYMFASEAWMVKRKADGPLDEGKPPAECDDREEVVIVTIETKADRKSNLFVAPIKRDKDKVELGPWDKSVDNGMVRGRFSGMFLTKNDLS